MTVRKSAWGVLLAAAGLLGATATMASAEQKLKVAYLRASGMIPHWHAEKMGFLKKRGLETEIITANNGPAVAAAVASGTADIGWSGSIPIITARSQNQPFKVFANGYYEISPSQWQTVILASERSGIKSMADIKGHTAALNAVGAVCELQYRDHLAKAGVKYSDIKTIVIPFPQLEATLELGNADTACAIEPFLTAIKQNAKIKATVISSGVIADADKHGPVTITAYFATESWLAKNAAAADSFRLALEEAHADLLAHPDAWPRYLVEEFKMSPERAKISQTELTNVSLAVKPEQWQPLIDAMTRQSMLANPVKVNELLALKPN